MRDIYLIDFENVASEGLSGITYLSEEDQVIIFYSNNSNRLSMKMHILIGKSVCRLSYFEVSVGGKNALDHQIATWLGYLIGTGAAERNYYIVSRDMGYKHVANFWASSAARTRVRCIENIRAAGRLERRGRERREDRQQTEPAVAAVEECQTAEPAVLPVTELTEVQVQVIAAETVVPELLSPEVIPVQQEEAAEESEPVETNQEEDAQKPEVAEVEPETVDLQPGAEAAEPEETTLEPEAAEVEPEETDLQPEAAEAELEESTQEPEPQEPQLSLEPWEGPQADPEDKPEEATPRRSYRSRTKFRRGKARYRENQPEQAEAKPQEFPEPQTEAEPEEKPAPQRQQRKTQSKREKRTSNLKEETRSPKNLEQLPVLLAPYPGLQENVLRELIQSNKRQVLCNTLRKQLGQEKGLALYNEIKKSAWH